MKRSFLTLAIALSGYYSYAQFSTSGGNTTTMDKVGVGTTGPTSALDVDANSNSVATAIVARNSGPSFASATGGVSIDFNSYASAGNQAIGKISVLNNGVYSGDMTFGLMTQGTFPNPMSERMRIAAGGNVGIGVTDPQAKLNVLSANNIAVNDILFSIDALGQRRNGISNQYSSYAGGVNNNKMSFLVSDAGVTSQKNVMTLQGDGNVGIGTDGPASKLTLYDASNTFAGQQIRIGMSSNYDYTIGRNPNTGYMDFTGFNSVGSQYVGYTFNGNVAIGTTHAQGYKLAVNGNVIAESVTVKLHGSWPDYVFNPNYKLLPLSQVKTYIHKNQHLPGMPSEHEVAKNGINLGEIVKVQTRKIEELTLYAIDQEKRIANLEAALSKLLANGGK